MCVQTLIIKNFKVFKNVEITNIPTMAVLLGMNGVGKSTFFDVFGFLNDCLAKNVKAALAARGGFSEVISREQSGVPTKILDFAKGEGVAFVGELKTREDINNADRRKQKLDSLDILAIKGLGQFQEFIES